MHAQHEVFFIFALCRRRTWSWNFAAMTRFAVLRCRLEVEYVPSIHFFLQRVTRIARHVFMTALQRESRLLVVKERRPPLIRVVA